MILPSLLFEEGHDVWLGNIRGTKYTLSHKDFDFIKDAADFFNYENVDISRNDVPTMIKRIVKTNKTCKKVQLIGHSAGS